MPVNSGLVKIFQPVVIFFICLCTSGCGEEAAEAPAETAPSVQEFKDAKTRILELERLLEKTEIKKQEIEKAKQISERQVQKLSDEAKSNERISWGLVIGVVLSLLVGVAIGSSSRKDASSKIHNLD